MAPMGRICEQKGVSFMEPPKEKLSLSFYPSNIVQRIGTSEVRDVSIAVKLASASAASLPLTSTLVPYTPVILNNLQMSQK